MVVGPGNGHIGKTWPGFRRLQFLLGLTTTSVGVLLLWILYPGMPLTSAQLSNYRSRLRSSIVLFMARLTASSSPQAMALLFYWISRMALSLRTVLS